MSNIDALPAVLKVREFATLMRLNAKTVYADVAAGRIPCIRIGSAIRIPRSVVERLLVEQAQRGSKDPLGPW